MRMRHITNSDGGRLYLVQDGDSITENDIQVGMHNSGKLKKNLVLKLVQSDSVDFEFEEQNLIVDFKGLAGRVALSRKPLNIEDLSTFSQEYKREIANDFDKQHDYLTKSILLLPMLNHKKEVIGIISLFNRKKDRYILLDSVESIHRYVLPYDKEIENFAISIASQASVALENVLLVRNIQDTFEGFIRASIMAIEQRDPSTRGHSERVATMAVALAREISDSDDPPFHSIHFNKDQLKEIQYASLLHDFGKIGVKEETLQKAKKLSDWNIQSIKERLHYYRESLYSQYLKEQMELSEFPDKEVRTLLEQAVKEKYLDHQHQVNTIMDFILRKNRPCYMGKEDLEFLETLCNCHFMDFDGKRRPILSEWEKSELALSYGTLNEEERKAVKYHVVYTHDFLKNIPWPKTLQLVPEIAYTHHERLDGSGYPRSLKKEQIPIQAQIMIVADVFDALTSIDRPYKVPLSIQDSLTILKNDAIEHRINKDFVDIFIQRKIYKLVFDYGS